MRGESFVGGCEGLVGRRVEVPFRERVTIKFSRKLFLVVGDGKTKWDRERKKKKNRDRLCRERAE